MSVLKIRDPVTGMFIPVTSIKGDKGDTGDPAPLSSVASAVADYFDEHGIDDVFNLKAVSIPWKLDSTYAPVGWRIGYYNGAVGDADFESKGSANYIYAYHNIDTTNYPQLEKAKYFEVIPPDDYAVMVLAKDSSGVTLAQGVINTNTYPDYKGKPVRVPVNPTWTYVVSLGRFAGNNTTYVNDADFINGIKLLFYYDRTLKRTGDFEFFTVNVDRPLAFGGEETTTESQEIECVLRLPASYSSAGTPTRLVLACHGASGYIDSSNEVWYNSNWKDFMDSLLTAGYAVFDANVLPSSSGVNQKGYALGSPLYVNVLKKAYDYIQENYNVYPQIFAHGTSMGGVGATAFSHVYPHLVLAESSFAGRDPILYLYRLSANELDERFAISYGYGSLADLEVDKFSHIEGASPSLSLVKYVDGVAQIPPDRETDYENWLAYYTQIGSLSRNSTAGVWMGRRTVPYKAWNSWADNASCTKLETVLKDAYNRGNACPYYLVNYETGTHTQLSYGQIGNMRDELIAWYKRWE